MAKRHIKKRNRGPASQLAKLRLVKVFGKIFDRKNSKQLKSGRYAILSLIPKNAVGVEVGVWKGDFSEGLYHMLEPSRLYLVDPWLLPTTQKIVFPRSKSGKPIGVGNEVIETQQSADRVYEAVKSRFSAYPAIEIIRASSRAAAENFVNHDLDWVYIDGSHYYEDVMNDLKVWFPKVRPGGVIFGDDYYWQSPEGELSVKQAVDEFVATKSIDSLIVYKEQFFFTVS